MSDVHGYDRGTPVDRYYITGFVRRHRADIRGQVLEVQDTRYIDLLGTGVERAEVLDILPSNPRATLIADLAAADSIAADQFDCVILTQTLQLIYDLQAAVLHAHRILRPGGVLLVTVPALGRLSRCSTDYWRFTVAACERLFGDVFGRDQISVTAFGNVLTGVAFHLGMAHEELSTRELEVHDPNFPLIIGVRATKHVRGGRPAAPSRRP